MSEENRLKITLWLKSGIIRRTDDWLEEDNCKSRREFAERALRSYVGYLTTEDTSEYFSHALVGAPRGTLADNKNRLHTLLFRLCVEVNMIGHIVATYFRADPVNCRGPRAFAVDEVLRINGKTSFGGALDLQRQVYPDG